MIAAVCIYILYTEMNKHEYARNCRVLQTALDSSLQYTEVILIIPCSFANTGIISFFFEMASRYGGIGPPKWAPKMRFIFYEKIHI